MALTAAQWTALHQRQQAALLELTVRDVTRLANYLLRFEALDTSFPAFARAVAVVVGRNRRTSAGIASAYLRAVRLLAGVRGELRLIMPELLAAEIDESLHQTSVAMAKKATARGDRPELAMAHAASLAGGSMARHVLNGGRQTIARTVQADQFAKGWRRVASGVNSCSFCRSLSGKVFDSSVTEFECHDRCGCTMQPIF